MRLANTSRMLLEDNRDDPECGKTHGTRVSTFSCPPPLPGEGEEVLRPASPSHALGRLSKGRKNVSLSSQNVASSSCSSYSDLALAPFSRTSEEK